MARDLYYVYVSCWYHAYMFSSLPRYASSTGPSKVPCHYLKLYVCKLNPFWIVRMRPLLPSMWAVYKIHSQGAWKLFYLSIYMHQNFYYLSYVLSPSQNNHYPLFAGIFLFYQAGLPIGCSSFSLVGRPLSLLKTNMAGWRLSSIDAVETLLLASSAFCKISSPTHKIFLAAPTAGVWGSKGGNCFGGGFCVRQISPACFSRTRNPIATGWGTYKKRSLPVIHVCSQHQLIQPCLSVVVPFWNVPYYS